MSSLAASTKRSLKSKLLLPLLLVGAALAALSVWGVYAEARKQLVGKLRLRAELIANAVNYAAESVARAGELQRIVAAIGAEEEVNLIVVVGGHPARVLAATRNAWRGQTLVELPAQEMAGDMQRAIQTRQSQSHIHRETAQLDFITPLLLSQAELAGRALSDGAVMVQLDMRTTQTAIWRLTCEMSLAFLAVLAILGALGYGLIRRLVLRPISRISSLVVQRREGASTDGAATAADDELGALARTLDDALTRTAAALHEVHEQNNAVQEEHERLAGILQGTHAGTWEWNVQTGAIIFNERWAEIIGYTLAEIAPGSMETWRKYTQPDDLKTSDALLEKHFRGALDYYACESRMQHKAGHWVWVLDRGKVTSWTADGQPLMMRGTHQDITARKQAEAEADKAKLEAQNWQMQKSESLGRMAGAIAHHFNNKLMAVMGNLELAMQDLPRDAEPCATLSIAMQAAHQAAEVSILMLAYLGQTPSARARLDLAQTCRQSLPILRAGMPPHAVLETDLPVPGPVINASVNQIQQVLTNLLTNAWEASGTDKNVIRLTVTTVAAADIPTVHRLPVDGQLQAPAYACLAVADTGSGIADKDIEQLFDPFFSTKFTGRGLGLPVVLGIVRTHGGVITVESALSRGSTFRIFLPLLPQASADTTSQTTAGAKGSLPVSSAPAGLSASHAQAGTVLVVEDDEAVRNVAANMLTRLGFAVLSAPDGRAALELFQQHMTAICCVLCDLIMPGMDGWATLTALRTHMPGLPVILASGYDEAQAMAGDHPELPQAFLGKPFQMQMLREALAKALAQ